MSLAAFDPAAVGIVAEATAFGDGFVKGFQSTLEPEGFGGEVTVEDQALIRADTFKDGFFQRVGE